MKDWYNAPEPNVQWLVHGLLEYGSTSLFSGKPKSGKSTAVRNLAAAVVKGGTFIGRATNTPSHGATVIYVHLDRKDQPAAVINDLKKLGVTAEESQRLILLFPDDMPRLKSERMPWLLKHVQEVKPDLLIIDLFFQFVHVDGSNGYNEILDVFNQLQDELRRVGFTGHLCVAHHNRKQRGEDAFDNAAGSISIRGSCATCVNFERDRKNKSYTLETEQSRFELSVGEIDKTTVIRDEQTGATSLGLSVAQLHGDKLKKKVDKDGEDLLRFIQEHPTCTVQDMVTGLHMRKDHVLDLLKEMRGALIVTGKGVRGVPKRYSAAPIQTEEVSL